MASIHPFHEKRTYIDDGCETELSSAVAPRTDGSLPKQAPRIPRMPSEAEMAERREFTAFALKVVFWCFVAWVLLCPLGMLQFIEETFL